MKKFYMLGLAMSLSMTAFAQTETYNAPLEMTAGAGWALASKNTPTINSEKEYYNNDRGGNAWCGCAYAEFDLSGLPKDATVTKATFTYSIFQNNTKGRTDHIFYMLPSFNFDESKFMVENEDKRDVANRGAELATNSTKPGENLNLTADVTVGVEALLEADAKTIFFQLTGNEGSAYLYGKTSANPPTLTIEYAAAGTSTSSWTVNFLCDGTVIKDPVTYTGAIVGTEVSASDEDLAPITKDDVKYLYQSGNDPITIAADASANVINLNFREAVKVIYTLTAVDSDNTDLGVVNSVEGLEGDIVNVGYPMYVLNDGKLYQTGPTGGDKGKEYKKTLTLGSSDMNENITYNLTDIKDVVSYVEGEDIPGATVSDYNNAGARTSKAGCGWSKDKDLVIANLPAGKYKLTAGFFYPAKAGKTNTFQFAAGENVSFGLTTEGNGLNDPKVLTSDEFEITEPTDLVMKPTGWRDLCLDFAYVQKTGVQTGVTEIESEQAGEMVIYNLMGQRVKNPTKGIYIINGKKVLVK